MKKTAKEILKEYVEILTESECAEGYKFLKNYIEPSISLHSTAGSGKSPQFRINFDYAGEDY